MECQICFENFDSNNVIPKILTKCGHSFCKICLNRLSLNSLSILCPICREKTKISEKGKFPTNHSLLITIEKEKSAIQTKENLIIHKNIMCHNH